MVSGHPLLVQAAVEAVQQWVFAPGMAGILTTGVPFRLDNSGSAPAPSPLPPAPNLIKHVEPVYPPLAWQTRVTGTVHLSIRIAADGHVEDIKVVSGHPLLVQAAIEAVKQWTFHLGMAGVYAADVPFSLDNTAAAPAQAAAAPPLPAKIKVGGLVQQSMLVNKVEPVYPPSARAAGIEGTVNLTVTIGEDGRVESVEAIDGSFT